MERHTHPACSWQILGLGPFDGSNSQAMIWDEKEALIVIGLVALLFASITRSHFDKAR